MHVHISWATALVMLLEFIVTIGALNLFYRSHPNAWGSNAWSLVASPN